MATQTSAAVRRARRPPASAATGNVPTLGTSAITADDRAPTAPAAGVPVRQAAPASTDVWKNPFATTYTPIPLVPPPMSDFPDLDQSDIASMIQEYSDWDATLSGLGLAAANASLDTSNKVAGIEQNLARGLENTDWSMASRGLGASSIKDTEKVQKTSDAAAAKGGAIAQLQNLENYTAGERNRGETQVFPGIAARYRQLNSNRHQARVDAEAAAAPPESETPAAPPPAAPTPTTPSFNVGATAPGGSSNIFVQDSGPRAGLRYVVHDGKRRYESRPGAGDWGRGGIIDPPRH